MKTLESLIKQLAYTVQNNNSVNIFELFAPLKSYTNEDWKEELTFENGQAKNTLLFQNEQLKVILIHWDSFQKSKKHGHPAGGGLIKVLSGNLVETLFDPTDPDHMIGKQRYGAGNISFVHDDMAHHMVENPARTPAVSLHVYAPAVYIPGFVSAERIISYQQAGLKVAA